MRFISIFFIVTNITGIFIVKYWNKLNAKHFFVKMSELEIFVIAKYIKFHLLEN